MEAKEVTYVELYKLKSGLQKQIKELDDLMRRIMPTDFNMLSKLVSDITLGVYDYPFNGLLKEKIIFSLKQLKIANAQEIIRYMKIVGDTGFNEAKFEAELNKHLHTLSNEKILARIRLDKDHNEIKYGVL